MTTTPYPHQIAGADRVNRPRHLGGFEGRALIADTMGLGKSFTSLLAARNAGWFPLVVVCPASLKYNWLRECQKHLGLRAEVLSGTRAPSNRLGLRNPSPPPIQVVNYEILDAWMTHLQLLEPKLVIVDEGHYLSNRESQRSVLVRELCSDVPNVLVLSGTPLPNRPSDLWNVLNLIRPDLYPDFFSFALAHCQLKKEYGVWNYRGAKDLPKLHADLTSNLMIRRRREDVINDLPPMQRHVLPIPLDDQSKYETEIDQVVRRLGAGASRAEALTQLNALRQSVGESKIPAVIQWIDDFLQESDGKVLVFGIHHAILEALHSRYKKNSVLLYGKKNHAERQRDEEAFQRNPNIRILFGNIHACGVGLNLTAADTVAVVEFPWRPSDLEQAMGRCYARVGDMHGADIYYLVGMGTVEEYMVELLQKKQGIADEAIDGREGASDFNISDKLIEKIRGTT